MSKKLKYLVIHVSDTPFGRPVTNDDLFFWHRFPAKNANGTYTYKGKKYSSLSALPDDSFIINGTKLSIRKHTTGRGWSVEGYSDKINHDGTLQNIRPYNTDGFVDAWEVTNGVAGQNSVARHVVIAGGWTKDGKKSGKFELTEIFSQPQIDQLIEYIKMIREIWPDIIIKGHYEFDKGKTCPNFDVPKFLKSIGINQ